MECAKTDGTKVGAVITWEIGDGVGGSHRWSLFVVVLCACH